jgi:hypothetical protein
MSRAPRLGIVIAALRNAHCDAGAIRSALEQTLADMEVIVVVGSTCHGGDPA